MRSSHQPSSHIWHSWWMSKRHKLLQNPQTNCILLFCATWGLLMYEAGKGNMQMLIFICIELIPLNSFLGFPNIFMVFSAYSSIIFLVSKNLIFFVCFHVKCCLKVLQFLNSLKVRISLENSIILNRKETAITEKQIAMIPVHNKQQTTRLHSLL